ncbi:MAG TPA: NAD(P)/FAD-dependent oxidoreductase [Haliangiales bacterium]|nr:NAD(P)/FAD-dependent oxidoreductase [Haliangiales bacterium]
MDEIDVAVIGAGAVGLACAAVLAERGRSVVLLERHRRVGQETSSRNSGVIHAGLYYPTGSLKALLCVEGRRLLYARCARDGVPHRRCAKILVATDHDERRKIEGIHAQGLANGAGDLRLLDGAEVTRLEPRVRAVAGLLSPETGIVDVHGLMDSYRREAEGRGAILAPDNTVTALERRAGGWRVRARTSTEGDAELYARWVVNAAGLDASRVAALAGVDVRALGYEQRLCKGDYFRIAARHAGIAGRLIYPAPVHAGLGIHITFDLGGKLLAGPDVEYIDRVRYDVDPAKAARFGAALRRYLPDIRDDDLEPDYAGIRPKLQGPGEPFRDFVVEEAGPHGAPGLVNLLGIESPGITAGEAIARRVAGLIDLSG